MSHLSSVFNSVPVKVPDRSGFDLSHENLFSATVGTLIPASVEEVLPGDVCSIGGSVSVELPPLATNFKGRVDARLETFFVPNRILWAGWQDFICQDQTHKPVVPGFSVSASIPQVRLNPNFSGPGKLSDFLGCKLPQIPSGSGPYCDVNALPFLAYHKIWDDWYRDSLVQQPFFVDGVDYVGSTSTYNASGSPFIRSSSVLLNTASYWDNQTCIGFNGRDLRSLCQRNFAKDYFTTMTTQPQSGSASELAFNIPTDGLPIDGSYVVGDVTGSFTIASLRAANALQKWLERNNIGGTRYYDQILAHFGVMPPDANVNRAVLLGSMTQPVIVNSISKTNESSAESKNPYSASTGAQFGRGLSFGKGRLVDKFEVKEHGFIITLFSLVPHAYYSTGSRRYLGRSGSGTYAFPEFAGIGDQEVYTTELNSGYGFTDNILWNSSRIAGYNQRFSEYKYHDDEVHGLLSDGQSLANFVLSRGFSGQPVPSTALLEIPTTFMDSVMVASQNVSGFNAIVDCYFDSKFLRVLPQYSLPHL